MFNMVVHPPVRSYINELSNAKCVIYFVFEGFQEITNDFNCVSFFHKKIQLTAAKLFESTNLK